MDKNRESILTMLKEAVERKLLQMLIYTAQYTQNLTVMVSRYSRTGLHIRTYQLYLRQQSNHAIIRMEHCAITLILTISSELPDSEFNKKILLNAKSVIQPKLIRKICKI